MNNNKLYLFILLLIISTLSCIKAPKYSYKYSWIAEVVYTTGEKDTLYPDMTVNNNLDSARLYLDDSCLAMTYGWGSRQVACGVRKFNIIESNIIVTPR